MLVKSSLETLITHNTPDVLLERDKITVSKTDKVSNIVAIKCIKQVKINRHSIADALIKKGFIDEYLQRT